MLPILELGPWQVSTYQVTVTLALTIGGMWAFHHLLSLNHPPGLIIRGLFLALLGGFAGTYLITYLINVRRIARSGLLVRPEGMSIIWGLVSVIGVATVYCWRHRISSGRALDLVAPPTALGFAIGRLGCFAAGCCYGRPTDSWLGMYLPDENGVWMMRYPTQLMSAATDLLIFVGLVAVERYGKRQLNRRGDGARRSHQGWPFDGFIFLLYADLYCLKRFGVEFLRGDALPPLMGPFNLVQIVCLAVFLIATVVIAWNLVRTAVPAATVPVSSVGE